MNGILNLYKESGFTSHDCVAKLRGIFKQKKIGHMGTLDPKAEGVLPVALGKATRLIELFDDQTKTYRAVMLLGTVTDTLDMEGKVLEENPVECSVCDIIECMNSFKGEIMQVPPMYSALKKDGKKLYELAREGIEIEREARPVTVYKLEIEDISLPRVTYSVTVSKGTYIRSLCDDIGKKLGCGACMEYLERTEVGGFKKENAYTLGDLQKLKEEDALEDAVLYITDLFPNYMKVKTKESGDKAAHNGNQVKQDQLDIDKKIDGRFWLFDSSGVAIGIYEFKKGMYFPVKMIYEG